METVSPEVVLFWVMPVTLVPTVVIDVLPVPVPEFVIVPALLMIPFRLMPLVSALLLLMIRLPVPLAADTVRALVPSKFVSVVPPLLTLSVETVSPEVVLFWEMPVTLLSAVVMTLVALPLLELVMVPELLALVRVMRPAPLEFRVMFFVPLLVIVPLIVKLPAVVVARLFTVRLSLSRTGAVILSNKPVAVWLITAPDPLLSMIKEAPPVALRV